MSDMRREALRQQLLLAAILRDPLGAELRGWVADADASSGLRAYQANAGATAQRALGAAFPTIAQLIGEESFAALARAHWHAQPPQRGDLAWFGERLPDFIEASAQLADEPYLADVARLDWSVHGAEAAADGPASPDGLALLSSLRPDQVVLRLRPGTALVESRHPIATVWHAHRSDDADRFAQARVAFAAGRGENALVWRDGWQVRVTSLGDADARFTRRVLDGATLACALEQAGDDFNFESWLIGALRERWLVGAALAEDTAP